MSKSRLELGGRWQSGSLNSPFGVGHQKRHDDAVSPRVADFLASAFSEAKEDGCEIGGAQFHPPMEFAEVSSAPKRHISVNFVDDRAAAIGAELTPGRLP